MTYENLGQGALDYFPCRYGKSKLLFRGPRKKMENAFVAMIGGTDTYGKYIEKPYPDLIGEALNTECVNFGCVNAGVDVFSNEPTVIDACAKARVTVVQVVGAQNMSNRFYAVHPRRNDRFLRASTLLKTIFRETDFTEFHFTKHLLSVLQEISEERFNIVRDELKSAWIARMKLLLEKIEGKTVLLWVSDRTPDQPSIQNGLGCDPLFVDRAMIEAIRPVVTEVIEVVPSTAALSSGTNGMIYPPMEEPAAREMLPLTAHAELAKALVEPLKRLM